MLLHSLSLALVKIGHTEVDLGRAAADQMVSNNENGVLHTERVDNSAALEMHLLRAR